MLAVSVPLATPVEAATQHPTTARVVAHVTPTTVHVGSVMVVAGTVAPRAAGVRVVLQRFVGATWHTVGQGRVTAAGAYSFSLKAPGTAANWTLRVTRAGTASTNAGVSATLHVRVVKAIFVVKAAAAAKSVADGRPLVVSGSVRPKATGSVQLQRLVGRTWHTLATARLTHASTFSFSTVRPAGSYRLRVAKAFTTKVAGGVSPPMTVTVAAPLAPPRVTTTGLPNATEGVPYSTILTGQGGALPYLWTSANLPAGLALSTAGVLSGTPTTAGTSTITVVVTDANGRAGSAVLALTVLPVPRLWDWGDNGLGQLGNGSSMNYSRVPAEVSGLTGVTAVASCDSCTYALRSDGTVWAWGADDVGQLGNGSLTKSTVPVQVSGLTGVTAIAAAIGTGYALRSDGTVWSWGDNSHSKLGDKSATSSDVPVQVADLTSVTSISGGDESGYALRSDGSVWAWGDNSLGQLGNNDISVNASAVAIQVYGLTSVTAISGGGLSANALRSDGTVWSWGYNIAGELGNGTSDVYSVVPVSVSGLTGITAIADGGAAVYALASDGTVWSWGDNMDGELGNNSMTASNVPVHVSGLAHVTAIAAGFRTGYALRSDGTEWAWGANGTGQLGNNTMADSPVPVQVSGLTGVTGLGGGPASATGYAIVPG